MPSVSVYVHSIPENRIHINATEVHRALLFALPKRPAHLQEPKAWDEAFLFAPCPSAFAA